MFAAVWGLCTSLSALFSLHLGLSTTLFALQVREVNSYYYPGLLEAERVSQICPLLCCYPKPDSVWDNFLQGPGVISH